MPSGLLKNVEVCSQLWETYFFNFEALTFGFLKVFKIFFLLGRGHKRFPLLGEMYLGSDLSPWQLSNIHLLMKTMRYGWKPQKKLASGPWVVILSNYLQEEVPQVGKHPRVQQAVDSPQGRVVICQLAFYFLHSSLPRTLLWISQNESVFAVTNCVYEKGNLLCVFLLLLKMKYFFNNWKTAAQFLNTEIDQLTVVPALRGINADRNCNCSGGTISEINGANLALLLYSIMYLLPYILFKKN